MRFFRYFSIIITIILLCLLCSCVKGEIDLKIEISPTDKSLIDLTSKVYDESQLLEIIKFDGSINELNHEYPIECLREDNGTYRASYLGDGSVAVLIFDDSGDKLLSNIYKTELLKSNFVELVRGKSLEDVRVIDPDGEYLFLYAGRNDTPKVSSHYTKDGYLITIKYDDLNTVTSINEEMI